MLQLYAFFIVARFENLFVFFFGSLTFSRPLQIQFIILSLLTVPLFSQLKTVSNLWISFFFSVILLCILPIFILYETSAATAIEAVILLILGAAFYLTFLSRLAPYMLHFFIYHCLPLIIPSHFS